MSTKPCKRSDVYVLCVKNPLPWQSLMGALKKRLGQAEVRDQIAAARHVVAESGIVDAQRVAVSGVSYGGYVVGMVLSDR